MTIEPNPEEPIEAEVVAEAAGEHQAEEVFGVPRRFGVGTILVITTAFGLLLSLLQALGAPVGVVVFVVAFVSLIGVGQMLLFDGTQPRRASLLAGLIGLPLLLGLTIGFFVPHRGRNNEIVCPICAAIIFGPPSGYLAGGIVAGVFLIMDAIEKSLGRWRRENKEDDD
jgi:hypothetical protein